MGLNHAHPINSLDRIRRTRGINACKSYFSKIEKANRQHLIALVNDDNLLFASLFILQPEIKGLNLSQELCTRNQIALNICGKILDDKTYLNSFGITISLKSDVIYNVLLWMFNTGAFDDGLCNEFDQVIDIAASILLKYHHEESILPGVANLIFKRNRKDYYHHDLIWAFFQTQGVSALRLIARYLRSSCEKDVYLARTLLHLPQDAPIGTIIERQKEYAEYMSWLEENGHYLYFTGENLQFSSCPTPCNLNLDAKYLSKRISARSHKPIDPYTEEELKSLKKFNEVQQEEKSTLAKYSRALYDKDQLDWNEWIQYPIEKQIHIAKNGRRGLI